MAVDLNNITNSASDAVASSAPNYNPIGALPNIYSTGDINNNTNAIQQEYVNAQTPGDSVTGNKVPTFTYTPLQEQQGEQQQYHDVNQVNPYPVSTATAGQGTAAQGTAAQGTASTAATPTSAVAGQATAPQATAAQSQAAQAAAGQAQAGQATAGQVAAPTPTTAGSYTAKQATAPTISDEYAKLTQGVDQGQTPDWARTAVTAARQRATAMGLGNSSIAINATAAAVLNAAQPLALAQLTTDQQTMLSNQAAINTARQFNASSKQQNDQFNTNLATQVLSQNADRATSVSTVNAQMSTDVSKTNATLLTQTNQSNAALVTDTNQKNAALVTATNQSNAQIQAQINSLNAQLQTSVGIAHEQIQSQINQLNAQLQTNTSNANAQLQTATSTANAQLQTQTSNANATLETQTGQFNSQQLNTAQQFIANLNNQVNEFNAQNQLTVDQSNVQWRRTINTVNTAGVNATNAANVQNLFNIQQTAQNNIWNEARDEASWSLTSAENSKNRELSLVNSALNRQTSLDILQSQQQNQLFSTLGSTAINILGSAVGNGATGAAGIGQGISNLINGSPDTANNASTGADLNNIFSSSGTSTGDINFGNTGDIGSGGG